MNSWALKLQQIANVLFKTRGFVPILVITGTAGSILAWMTQGQDLLRSVTDVGINHDGFSWQVLWLCLAVTVLGFQAWFWARVIVEEEFGARASWPYPLYLEWIPRILGLVPFVLLIIALRNLHVPNPWLAIVLAGLGAAFLIFVWFRVNLTRAMRKATGHLTNSGFRRSAAAIDIPLNWLRRIVLWVGIGYAAVTMAVLTYDPVTLPVLFGPAAVVLTACALIIPVITSLMLLGSIFHVRVVTTLLIIAVVVSFWVDNHAVRLSGPAPTRVQLKDAYAAWKKPFEGSTKPIPMIFVASEGGASRAGYWTAAVMSQLETETHGEFSKHIFAVSSISGGSLGVAGFIATVKDAQAQKAIANGSLNLREAVSKFVGQDYLSPALAGMLFPDLLQRFFPFSVFPDRATALEVGWEDGWADHCADQMPCDHKSRLSNDFMELWRDTPNLVPVWLVGGAMVEDGRPIITSSVDFGDSIDAWDFHSLTGHDVRLSTAILNGARFPYVSPGGTIEEPKTPQKIAAIHIVDGGYFDAAGVEAVRELAESMLGPGGIAANDNIQPIFLLITNDGINPPFEPDTGGQVARPSLPIGCRGKAVKSGCPGQKGASSIAPDLVGPLVGLYRSRSAHGERLKALLYRAPPRRAGSNVPSAVLSVDLCEYAVPMNWALSENARRMVDGLLLTRDPNEKRECEKANNAAFSDLLAALRK
ncbi:hypothetical protein [Rhizobium ruizarguesonis]|uniref:hypothetical protein n=1 Tax=Rhizobium ruizarguesonis TaxID=2081791 RepID=UPI0010301260|nr:hypothetical protein [Rhizobium ruizarguesonis]TBD09820.1 hypothetical protein ELH23_32965 [Rhizobium ruizarguesonis]